MIQLLQTHHNLLTTTWQYHDITFTQFHEWSFIAPTIPPAVFLNTRTQRMSDEDIKNFYNGARDPVLINCEEYTRLKKLIAKHIGKTAGEIIIFVSPSPVLTLKSVENGIVMAKSPIEGDIETFNSNSITVNMFLDFLDSLRCKEVILISGDVHYATTAYARLGGGGDFKLRKSNAHSNTFISQFTSSAIKNQPTGMKLRLLKVASNQAGYYHNVTYFYHRGHLFEETFRLGYFPRLYQRLPAVYKHASFTSFVPENEATVFYKSFNTSLKYDFVSTSPYIDFTHSRSVIKSNFGYLEKGIDSNSIKNHILNSNNEIIIAFEENTNNWPI